jgi:1-phosphofructokinase family hexose kinase
MAPTTGIATITLNPAIDQSVAIPGFAAGEVNRVDWEQSDPGGKGVNVASFLADLGFRVAVTGLLGRDNAPIFEKLFAQKALLDRFVRIEGKTRVNVKILDEAQHRITDINFPGHTGTAADLAALESAIDALASDHDWFVLSGSVPTGVSQDWYAHQLARLKAAGKTVVLDTSGEPLRAALASAPYAIKPNIAELEELLGERLRDAAAVANAARRLVRDGIACVVVSMGREGALFVEADQSLFAVPPPVDVKSTVGAGDAMVAGLVAAKLRGWPLAECARLATATAVGALTQLGPRLPAPAVIESLLPQVTVQAVAAA